MKAAHHFQGLHHLRSANCATQAWAHANKGDEEPSYAIKAHANKGDEEPFYAIKAHANKGDEEPSYAIKEN